MYKKYKVPIVIAEIGCNHKGDINVAKEYLDIAKNFCKLKYVKFQKRDPKNLLTKKEYNSPHPVPENSYGKTYGEHREFLEFDVDQHKYLFDYCKKIGLIYSSSVWDIKSAEQIVSLKPELIKIGSATNTNTEVLNYLCSNFIGKIHISLGMTTRKEEEEIIKIFTKTKRLNDLVLYACTSNYPVDFSNLCLREITRIVETYGKNIFDIGFSGHHNGISADIAAYTLGANYIERHFTLDRTWVGTDHAASLEPDGFRKLIRDLENVKLSIKYKNKEILDTEIKTREKLKFKNYHKIIKNN